MNYIISIILILLVIAVFVLYYFNLNNPRVETRQKALKHAKVENFENYTLEETTTNFANPSSPMMPINRIPNVEMNGLLQGDYPLTGKKGISNNGADKIWQDYPIVEVGSYEQTTNNIRYPDNPDEGTCMPASMCGALYKDKHMGSNVITPLPVVNNTCGTRVGYFTTDPNLLPFSTDQTNILY